MKLILLTTLFIMTSCANYLNKIHQEIDRDEKRKSQALSDPHANDPYGVYRQGARSRQNDKRPILNPVSFSNENNVNPNVRRVYRNRYKSEDLVDNDNSSSLWSGEGRNASLFTRDERKKPGDIIVINVLERFKNDISNELRRVSPEEKKSSKPGENNQSSNQSPASGTSDDNVQLNPDGGSSKVFDRISTQVVEEISSDYILVKGKKEVLFRNQRRLLEVQALVSRRDIYDNDRIESDKILESRIFVLK
jgi:flagellar basal body L-ring protein FlgH